MTRNILIISHILSFTIIILLLFLSRGLKSNTYLELLSTLLILTEIQLLVLVYVFYHNGKKIYLKFPKVWHLVAFSTLTFSIILNIDKFVDHSIIFYTMISLSYIILFIYLLIDYK